LQVRFVVVAALIGCQGEAVQSTPVDSAAIDSSVVETSTMTDSTSVVESGGGETETGPCSDVPGNLLVNGSFEIGDTTPAAWNGSGLSTMMGDAYHCGRYAKWKTPPSFGSIDQRLTIAAAPSGSIFELSFYAKPIDGSLDGFLVTFQPEGGTPLDKPTGGLMPGVWTKLGVTFITESEMTKAVLAIRNGDAFGREIAFDHFVLIRKK
jgi:hypothetical protein